MMLLTGSKKESTLKFYERAGYNSRDKTGFIQWLELVMKKGLHSQAPSCIIYLERYLESNLRVPSVKMLKEFKHLNFAGTDAYFFLL